jgi:peptide chain release factor 1
MLPIERLESLKARFRELEDMLCRPDVATDAKRLMSLNRERADLVEIVGAYERYQKVGRQLADDRDALKDPELREMAEEEIPQLERELAHVEEQLSVLLLPSDPNDARNTVLEIRAGTGGEEAALFAADLFRMYSRYADGAAWRVEILSTSEASAGGFKEIVALVSGTKVYSRLRFEGGVHRVQRVPATESQGRIHTSTATVAVLPEADDVEVDIADSDLEISIAASGGPGGQGVNTTNSAVQIQHKPTGLIVKCQDERSQLKNKAKALKVLKSRLLDMEREKQEAAVSAERRGMVGTGERSQKIRTYNYPQNRVSDHRIKLTLNKLERIIEGDLEELVTALRTYRQAALLNQVNGGTSMGGMFSGDDNEADL